MFNIQVTYRAKEKEKRMNLSGRVEDTGGSEIGRTRVAQLRRCSFDDRAWGSLLDMFGLTWPEAVRVRKRTTRILGSFPRTL
jgi:hypothetical protein